MTGQTPWGPPRRCGEHEGGGGVFERHGGLFPNPVVAESLLDRLIDTSHQVIMNGPSYRPNKRPKNPVERPSKPTIT